MNKALSHIFRHCWLWLIEFYLRPLDVMDRAEKVGMPEFWAAVVSGLLWGGLVGIPFWFLTNSIHFIWMTAVVFIFIGVVIILFTSKKRDIKTTTGFSIQKFFTIVDKDTKALSLWLFTGTIIFTISIIIEYTTGVPEFVFKDLLPAFKSDLVDILIVCSGIAILTGFPNSLKQDKYNQIIRILAIQSLVVSIILFVHKADSASTSIVFSFAVIFSTIMLVFLFVEFLFTFICIFINKVQDEFYKQINIIHPLFFIISNIFFLYMLFNNLNNMSVSQIIIFSTILASVISSTLKILEVQSIYEKTNFPKVYIFSSHIFLWALLLFDNSQDLELTLVIIYLYLALTGFIFYPFVALFSIWQYRLKNAQQFNQKIFKNMLPFQWQIFPYPLPYLQSFLVHLAQYQNSQIVLIVMHQIQLKSLQVHPVRRATQAIAITPKLAIDFCQTIAEETNSKTLLSLSVNSPLARSFAIITPEPEKDEQIYIWAGSFPPKHSQIEWYQIFHDTSQMNLQTQLRYSLDNLKQYKHYKGYQQLNEQFQQWLKYSRATNLSQLIEIAELQSKNTQGYSQQAVNLLRQQLKDLPKYIKLEAINARREFLNQQKEHLSSLTYGEIPNYWKNLAQRVNQHWQTILEQEAEQAKDILKLDIQLTQNNLVLGQQTLNFKIYSTALAQNICLKINDHAHIFWNHNEVKRDILEAGRDTQLQLTADIKQAGNHTINGILSAQDTNDIEIQHPFSFQILVATKGKPYQIPELAPYTVGTRLNSDTTFTGRSDLINWLTGLWKHPEKSAIVLIGQRRIGKSSLLTKLKRDYQNLSNAAPLIPIFVDIQDVNSDYSFFKTASREMATALKQPVPHISREEPIEDFKDFLFSLELQNQKFLLMIDEADLMPSKKFSADLFHMLRSLMQGEQYPVLVLFCGTYQLQRLAWDYASIFFNTTLMRPVSYLSHNESNELLTRPATDILEYDETALNHAYELTNGHPYLLQKLGSILIEHYNDCVTYGEQRSNYVGYQDIDFIADKLIKASDNAAFIEHWKNSDLATKQILSTLATQTNETNRRQLTIESLSLKLKQEDMPLLSQQIVDIIKQQVKETILKPQGQGYSFVVPLQRRWIEWEYPIKDVRLMLDK